MTEYHTFDCGCKIPIIDGHPQVDFDNLDYECGKTWDLYCKGHTQSVFQLESYVGKRWSAELKPRNIEEAAALAAIIRPGTANAQDENGVSLTKVFCDRKNGISPIDEKDPLYEYTKDTQCIQIYQETILIICREVGQLSNKSQAKLLKALGKKNSEILISLRKEFVEGAVRSNKLTEEQANFVFDNIEAAGKYSFNKAHAVGYAVVGYQTAWAKAHLPKHYICAWLRISEHESKPLEEIRAMISEGHRLQIPIVNPSVKNLPETRFFIRDNTVYFGISSIKNCSASAVKKIIDANIDLSNTGWLEFLVLYSELLNKRQLISMIRAGCFDYTGFARMYCEHQFEQWDQITKGQKKRLAEHYKSGNFNRLEELISAFIQNAKLSKNDGNLNFVLNALINPSVDLYDSPTNVIAHEKELMGINLSCSKIQRANIPSTRDTCRSVYNKNISKYKSFILVGEISEYKEFKIKKGKMAGQIMANLKLVDDSGECEIVVFPDKVDLYQSALYDGNVVLIMGKQSNRGGLILEVCNEV